MSDFVRRRLCSGNCRHVSFRSVLGQVIIGFNLIKHAYKLTTFYIGSGIYRVVLVCESNDNFWSKSAASKVIKVKETHLIHLDNYDSETTDSITGLTDL